MKSIILKCTLATLGFFVICATLPARGSDGDKRPILSATDVKEVVIRCIPFDENQDKVSVAASDGKYTVAQVELKKTIYHGNIVEQIDSQPIINHGRSFFCYELQSKDKDVPYIWYIWLDNPDAGKFKLFVTPDGQTYLTYVDMWSLCFVEVSKPMDKTEKMKKLDDKLNDRYVGLQGVSVNEIIRQGSWVDRNTSAFAVSIYLTSFEKDGKGGFKLQMHGKDPNIIYTLVSDKEAEYGWRLEQ